MIPVHEFLRRSAAKRPTKEAVICGATRLTYSALDDGSEAVARFLAARGVERGDRVGIFSAKNAEETIALFGILKAGAAFVHINPFYREAHLRHVIEDSGVKALFIDNSRWPVFAAAYPEQSPVELVESLSDGLQNQSAMAGDQQLPETLASDDLAAIVYTSGSTGMPKGIVITHEIFHDATVHSAAVLGNTEEDRLISVTPLSFDGALSQLFTATLVGGTFVQQPSALPGDVVTTLLAERVTGMHAMPSFWRTLLHPRSSFAKENFPSLRYVSIIGEATPQGMLARLRAILPACDFYMMYGTTEAFRSTYLPPCDLDRKQSSAGIPFPGVKISIVREDGAPCSPGEVGTIVHHGNFVSPGYWNDATRTRATFRDDGLNTGDLGRVDEDGYLYVTGRSDGLIKTMGFRVSPEEVENCLSEITGVRETVVVGVTDTDGATTLKAVLVCDGELPPSTNDVRLHCRQRLPHYMIPTSIEFRSSLPKTMSNKISRAAVQ